MRNGIGWRTWLVILGAGIAMAGPGFAEEGDDEQRIEEVEEKVDTLAEEFGRFKSIFVVPEDQVQTSFSGLGPYASKVYKRDSGLSIGGYGEVRLRTYHNQDNDDRNDVFDALRAVLYVGYKYDDKWVFNSELEFEHAGTGGGGSVSTEFATIDYLWRDELAFRAGLLLVPMGFVNEIHEPNFFFGAERPEVERVIMPSTWRENGAGIFGRIADRVDYRFYVINGFDGSGFDDGGLRGGRQRGSRALSDDFAFVGRIDVDVVDGLMLGGSVYAGQSGQEQDVGGVDLPDSMTHIYEVHGQYRGYGLSLRALWSQAFIDEAGRLNRALGNAPTDAIASDMNGWYVEAGYDILPLFCDTKASLEPFFRFESIDTQASVPDGFAKDNSRDYDLYVAGLQFKPIPQVVFKADYRHFDLEDGHRANEIQALVGYVF